MLCSRVYLLMFLLSTNSFNFIKRLLLKVLGRGLVCFSFKAASKVAGKAAFTIHMYIHQLYTC